MMKKGCFLSTVVFLTIFIGIGLFLYKKYWPEIKRYGKEKIIEKSINDLEKKIGNLKPSKFQDSLIVLIHNQKDKILNKESEESFREFGNLIEETKFIFKNGIIDSTEFYIFKNMVAKNERSKKNRN